MIEVEQVDKVDAAKARKVSRVISWLSASNTVRTYKHLVIACDGNDMRIWTETDIARWFNKAAERMVDTGDTFEESLSATTPESRADDDPEEEGRPDGEMPSDMSVEL